MRSIPGYQVLDCLYDGDRSTVYRGIREVDGRSVVLKWIKVQSTTQLDRYRQEYGLLRALNLAGVIQAYDVLTYQGSLVTVLEDIGGDSLATLQRDHRFTLSEILYLGMRIAGCLAELHAAGLIHRDINPEHIIWNLETNQLKLIDFKLAATLISDRLPERVPMLQPPTLLEGNLVYMSPEQTGRMSRSLDYRTDFYSLGATLYELLTGAPPFTVTDPLELVHCHIAQTPVPPHLLSGGAPLVVSQIIMKLLAKNPDDRYQSGVGIQADFQTCLERWQQSGRIDPFSLGANDVVSRFQLPSHLYGRDVERTRLCQIIDRVTQRCQPEVVLITGESGVGKTSLGRSLRATVSDRQGYLIIGKFEQQYTTTTITQPYIALVNAFSDLVRQLLMLPDAELADWRTRLQAALGKDYYLMAEVIPQLELIVGKQRLPQPVPIVDWHDRFHLAFQNLIQVFTQASRLLVLVLDDVHWADPASLKLLQLLITVPNTQLLLIGIYRPSALEANHSLAIRLAEISGQLPVQTIALEPLDLSAITELTADTLRRSPEEIQPLAALIAEKTGGYPLVVKEFLTLLHRRHLIWFDPTTHHWQWHLEPIQALDIADNEAALLTEKMQSLSESTRRVLSLAAYLGNPFELVTLVTVAQQPPRETAACLWGAVVEGFIVPLDNAGQTVGGTSPAISRQFMVKYQFAHDRLRQAAYDLVPPEQRSSLHWQIGQQLWQNTPPDKRDEKIFEIVTQLNAGISHLTTQAERDHLAHLNLLAAKRAKITAAAEAALTYCQVGITLVGNDGWQRCYDMMLDLHLRAANAAYLSADYRQVETLLGSALPYVRSLWDRIAFYEIWIQALKSQNRELEAITIALPLLTELGITLPRHPRRHHLLWATLRTKVILLTRSSQMHRLAMANPVYLATMHLLSGLVTTAVNAAPELVPLILVEQLWLSRRFGNTAESALAYAIYGSLLCANHDIRSGYQLGEWAIALMQSLEDNSLQASIRQTIVTSIKPWKEHARTTLPELADIHQTALELGDLATAATSLAAHSFYAWSTGTPLSALAEIMATAAAKIAALNQQSVLHWHQLGWQLVLNLMGNSSNPRVLDGNVYDRQLTLPLHEQANDTASLFTFHVLQLYLCYQFADYEQALTHAKAATHYRMGSTITALTITFTLYQALSCLAAISIVSASEHQELWHQVSVNRKILRYWAAYAPMNCLHHVHLVEAECNRLRNRKRQAIEHYDHAIALAYQHGYNHDAALAQERAALFYLDQNQPSVASTYLQDAYHAYCHWGAIAKVTDLEQRYPELLGQTKRVLSTSKPPPLTSDNLDLAAVMRAAQAISSEIVLSRLLERIMTIVLENAGARVGYLLTEHDEHFIIEIKGTLEQVGSRVEQVSAVATDDRLPLSLIRYVAHTQDAIVLDDASNSQELDSPLELKDPYIKQHQPRSILCLPLLHQGKLVGIFYLENDLIAGAFTPNRLEVLRLLCSQAAISLENARLYEQLEGYSQTLEEKVQERTQELQQQIRDRVQAEESLQQAKEAAEIANRAKSEFLSKMSHELRTPLNAILGFTQVLTRDATLSRHQRKFLEIINRSGEYLLSLINDVLEMSRIEAGQVSLNLASFDLHRLLNSLTEMLQLKAESKGLHLVCDRAAEVPQFITTDESKLRQVLINLLGNAIKFTQQGQVILRVAVADQAQCNQNSSASSSTSDTVASPTMALAMSSSESEDLQSPQPIMLYFEVEDTGPGIAPDELDQLFKTFSQTETGRRSQQGSGLGLAISKQFVQLMGGDISVASVVDQGSTFRFSIPVTLSRPVTSSTARRVIGLAPNQPIYRILVVENSWESRQLMLKLLSLPGLDVRDAANGVEAIEIWQAWHPHLIWMDMQMPVMDGFQATQYIRAYETGSTCELPIAEWVSYLHDRESLAPTPPPTLPLSANPTVDNSVAINYSSSPPVQPSLSDPSTTNSQPPKTVIIALTASVFESDRMRSLAAGCDDFVRKPFSEGILFEKMSAYLGMELIYDTPPLEVLPTPTVSKPADDASPLPELATCLAAMPPDWVTTLRSVATRLDAEVALQLVSQIPSMYSPLADTLTDWINNFRFDRVIQFLSPPESEDAS